MRVAKLNRLTLGQIRQGRSDGLRHPDFGQPLSPRMAEIVRMRATGMRNKEIAPVLGLSYSTLRSHWMSIRARLGAEDAIDALRLTGYISVREPARTPGLDVPTLNHISRSIRNLPTTFAGGALSEDALSEREAVASFIDEVVGEYSGTGPRPPMEREIEVVATAGKAGVPDTRASLHAAIEDIDAVGVAYPDVPPRWVEEGCAHHHGNLTYKCSCLIPRLAVNAAIEAVLSIPLDEWDPRKAGV